MLTFTYLRLTLVSFKALITNADAPVTQDPRLQTTLRQRHGETFCERSLIVCSGSDMVNISCTNIIFKDVATATVGWSIFSLYLLMCRLSGLETRAPAADQ